MQGTPIHEYAVLSPSRSTCAVLFVCLYSYIPLLAIAPQKADSTQLPLCVPNHNASLYLHESSNINGLAVVNTYHTPTAGRGIAPPVLVPITATIGTRGKPSNIKHDGGLASHINALAVLNTYQTKRPPQRAAPACYISISSTCLDLSICL